MSPMLPENDAALVHEQDPGALLEAHYQQFWETRGQTLPLVNSRLQVAAIGFARYQGDWLGVMVTPWFIHLLLLSGGGTLWGAIPAGQRRYLELPFGTLPFTAEDDPEIGPWQYSPLVERIGDVPDMTAARLLAADALHMMENLPLAAMPEKAAPKAVSRRGFFRRLAGKRD